MEEYIVYKMYKDDDFFLKAIDKDELLVRDHNGRLNQPEDYFPFGCTDIEEVGDLEIDGTAAHWLPTCIDLKG